MLDAVSSADAEDSSVELLVAFSVAFSDSLLRRTVPFSAVVVSVALFVTTVPGVTFSGGVTVVADMAVSLELDVALAADTLFVPFAADVDAVSEAVVDGEDSTVEV
jgi:hypothetical protein